ncbi:MAG: aminomethyl-transferring glycine dehydrogenase [Verrucomicrobiales bacterium]
MHSRDIFRSPDEFLPRHLGPSEQQIQAMCERLTVASLDDLMDEVVPVEIRGRTELPTGVGEASALRELRGIMQQNGRNRPLIGQGFYPSVLPAPIKRHVLENPGWYTPYTPYQAELAQGRLEALLNYQTMICSLTGADLSNASLLDESTAAAEAMSMAFALRGSAERQVFLVHEAVHPQTLDVLITRAEPLGIVIRTVKPGDAWEAEPAFAVLWQNPATDGALLDLPAILGRCTQAGLMSIVVTDPLFLCVQEPPVKMGADVVVGSVQRFGLPLGGGGPHAGFFATRNEFRRLMPGRLVGVSKDRLGNKALRLALQTREQHIRREKATSNICTAQALLAVLAGFYAVYHGPQGLQRIALQIHWRTRSFAAALKSCGWVLRHDQIFDTLRFPANQVVAEAGLLLRRYDNGDLGLSIDESVESEDLKGIFCRLTGLDSAETLERELENHREEALRFDARRSALMEEEVFHRYHDETSLLRYITRLVSADFSLANGMIPLGSCTMKLNAAVQLEPLGWPEVANAHPFAPEEELLGYWTMVAQLEGWLGEITGLPAVSVQPNAGSQGELAGLLAIRAWHRARGGEKRKACLIPTSAHGTNPASAVMAGLKVVSVACDRAGRIDGEDLRAKIAAHSDEIAAMMITYPSTFGVFDEGVRDLCSLIHKAGGLVYLDGANMNALAALSRPGDFGVDVCHLNLHKTFCIPHGGGGPGVGPVAGTEALRPFLPGGGVVGSMAAAPMGSASILTISWMYLRMMGNEGIRKASQVAILAANYVAERLDEHFPVLFRGAKGRVAHECILDLRGLKGSAGVEVEDVAKRLMDYGFHAPTVSWPVPGSLMVEPTESESLEELERFCHAMISIREEISKIERGTWDPELNPLKLAPHPVEEVCADMWPHPYSRQEAAYPTESDQRNKFWPSVARIDNVYGDRHLFCSCSALEDENRGN